jgi:hypothetical protein
MTRVNLNYNLLNFFVKTPKECSKNSQIGKENIFRKEVLKSQIKRILMLNKSSSPFHIPKYTLFSLS